MACVRVYRGEFVRGWAEPEDILSESRRREDSREVPAFICGPRFRFAPLLAFMMEGCDFSDAKSIIPEVGKAAGGSHARLLLLDATGTRVDSRG
jgi:hypothetical protein